MTVVAMLTLSESSVRSLLKLYDSRSKVFLFGLWAVNLMAKNQYSQNESFNAQAAHEKISC